jgi:pimeloyl-ACP methyl ester carboxylesterase
MLKEFDIQTSVGTIRVAKFEFFPQRPTIIFLHDSWGCIELWRDFPKQLGESAKCNVLIYDRQGYGKSSPFLNPKRGKDYLEREVDILYEILVDFGIDSAILFGHSDGGSIALIAAAKHPDKIAGVITEGAHVFVEDITLDGIKEGVISYKTTDLKKTLEKYHGNKTDDLFWAWANTWTNPNFRDWSIEMFIPSITCPTLIIQGENDEFGTLEQVERVVSQTAGKSTKLVIPNIKHNPHKEIPDLVIKECSNFISQIISY